MGPKIVIVLSGVELNGVVEFVNDLKEIIRDALEFIFKV